MNEQEFIELSAGHALGALSPDDATAFDRARREHPEWEHRVRADAETAAALADTVPEVAPPAGIREALLAQIVAPTPDAATQRVVEDDVRPVGVPSRRPRRRAWFVLAACLALLIGAGTVAVVVGQTLPTPASVVALNEIEAAPDAQQQTVPVSGGGEATAHWSESVGKVVLVSDGLPELSSDDAYELWFVRDGAPISAGVFTAEDGDATTVLDGEMQPGDVIAVTVEAAGGSTTGQPTSDPILAIETS